MKTHTKISLNHRKSLSRLSWLFLISMLSTSLPAQATGPGTDTVPAAGGRWKEIDAISVHDHTATLLADGRVLIAGGWRTIDGPMGDDDYEEFEEATYIFDPATDQFTAQASLVEDRAKHLAALMADGRVLIVGGFSSTTYGGGGLSWADTEIYDPQTGQSQWVGIEPFNYVHGNLGATLTGLQDGRVLYCGGGTAMTYDPSSNQWTSTATPMTEPRIYHSATLLPNGDVLLAGGSSSVPRYDSMEIYRPAQDQFVALSTAMSHPRERLSAALLQSGKVLIYGATIAGPVFFTSDVYDPLTDSVTPVVDGAPYGGYTLVGLLDGRALAVGGAPSTSEPSVMMFVPAGSSGSWLQAADLNHERRYDFTLTALPDGRALVVGGNDIGYAEPLDKAEIYYPVSILPIADASATKPLWVSPINTLATVVLDGSRSSDPNGDPLTYEWFSAATPIATGRVAVALLPVGTHAIDLVVDDGLAQDTNTVTITVLTAEQAVERLITLVNASDLRHKQPLLASLEAALKSIGRGNCNSAMGQLRAFQNKVRAQVTDPVLAMELTQGAEQVIAALGGDGSPPVACKIRGLKRHADGCMRLEFSGAAGAAYIIEASTNLVDWEAVCVVRPGTDGECEFEDPDAAKHPCRFYRVSKSEE